MKKFFTYLTITLVVISTLYIGLWYFSLYYVTNQINKALIANKFASQNLETGAKKSPIEIAYVKAVSKLPFKLGIDVFGIKYSEPKYSIHCHTPLRIQYHFTKKLLSISYIGDCIQQSYSANKNYGNKITLNFSLKNNLPLSKKLFNLIKNKNLFELINFIEDYHLKLANFEIVNLVDSQIKYLINDSYLNFKFSSNQYYCNWKEFLQNIPAKIFLDMKVVKPQLDSYSPGFSFLTSGTLETDFTPKNLQELLLNSKIRISKFEYEDKNFSVNQKSGYSCFTTKNAQDLAFELISNFYFKDRDYLAKKLLWQLKTINNRTLLNLRKLSLKEITNILSMVNTEKAEKFEYDAQRINIPDKLTLKTDIVFHNHNGNQENNVNNLSLLFPNSSIIFQYSGQNDKNNKAKNHGTLSLFNYQNIVKQIINLYMVFKESEDELLSALYEETWNDLLPYISNHEYSISNNLIIGYNIAYDRDHIPQKLLEISDKKMTVKEIIALYNQTLFSKVYQKVQKSVSPALLVQRLLPHLKNKPNILAKLNQSPEYISDDLWREIFNSKPNFP